MNDNEKTQHKLMMREVAQNALEASSVVIIRTQVTTDFPIVFISDNVKRYGYSADEIMRDRTLSVSFVYSEDVARLNKEFTNFLKAGVSEYVREYRIVTADNDVRWIEERLIIEWDKESGRATYCQGIQIDIAERKRAEQALARSMEEMRVRTHRLEALNRLTEKLITASDENEVFQILKQQLSTVIDADRLSIALPCSDGVSLEIFLIDEVEGMIRTGDIYAIDSTWIGHVFEGMRPVFTPNHADHDHQEYDQDIQILMQLGWYTSIFIPLTFGDRVLGTLNVLSTTAYKYSDDDVQFLLQIAVPIAATLANQQLITKMLLVQDVVADSAAVVFQWAPEPGFPVIFVTDNVRQFGYTPEELMSGRVPYLSIVHPDEHSTPDDHIEFWENQDRGDHVDQYRIVSPTGETYWVEDHTIAVRDEDGNLLHLQSLVQDITKDKLVEEKLRFANTVVENSPVVLLRWYATEGYPIDFVTQNIDQFGYSPEELASNELSYAEIVHPDDLEWQTKEIAQLIDVGMDEFTLVYRIVTKNKEVRWVEDRTTIERDERGHITHLQGMILDITERKKSEELMQLTQYSVDSAVDMIFWLTKDGHFAYVNTAAYQTLGYVSETELLNRSIFDIVPDYDLDSWYKRWESVKVNGTLKFEAYFKLSPTEEKEHIFPIEVTANYHQVGEREYVFAFCRDISERRKAAEALQASEQQLRLMLDNLPNAVCIARLDGKLVYINQSYRDLFGITPDMMSTFDVHDLYKDSLDRNTFVQLITRDGFVNKWETELLRADRAMFAASISSQLFSYHGETVTLSSIFDLTEKVEAEKVLMRARDVAESANEKLKKSEAMIRSVLDQIPIFTALTRFDGSVIYVNHAGEAMFGSGWGSRDKSAALSYKDPNDRVELMRLIRQDGVVPELLCDMIYMNGDIFKAKVSSRVIEYDGEEALLTCIFDLTEQTEYEETLKKARDSAEAANEAKSDFLASMSHELRTPLNGILGYTQLLARDPALGQKHKKDIRIIHESGEHLFMLITDILDFSKIEAHKLELQERVIHTASFLQGVVDIIRMRAMEKHLEFVVEIAPDLPPGFISDEIRLRQILFNLLGNAVKFTQHGEVIFRVEINVSDSHNPYLVFTVEDTGIGIKPEKVEMIFDPFVQVGDKMSRIAGTGLGLAISQQLAQKMNSTIRVSSQIGKGSAFSLNLPMSPVYDIELNDTQTIEKKNRHINTQETILIVDDNPINRAVLRDWLIECRFTIVEAENGRDALNLAQTVSPDLIITDLIMPELDGYELVQQIRSGHSCWRDDMPIIALSASASDDLRKHTLEAGCNTFLSKPVKVDELLDSIDELLQLEWVYSEIIPQNALQWMQQSETDIARIKRPNIQQIDLLIAMVELGDMMGVVDCANRLVDGDPSLPDFVQHVKQFADRFEDEKLLHFLQSGENSH